MKLSTLVTSLKSSIDKSEAAHTSQYMRFTRAPMGQVQEPESLPVPCYTLAGDEGLGPCKRAHCDLTC